VEYNLDKDRRWVLGALKEMPLGCVRHWEKIYKLYSEFRSQKPEGKTLKHIKELTAACDLAHSAAADWTVYLAPLYRRDDN